MRVLMVIASVFLAHVSSQCISENDNAVLPPGRDLRQVTPFSIQLFREVLPPSGNFFFSPYSIWTALVLAYFGSNGDTKAQLERVLRLSNRDETLALFRKVDHLYSSQTNTANYTIDAANRIYVQEGLPLKNCLQSVFSDEMKSIDFKQATRAAAVINQFVSDTTRGKIPQLVTAETIGKALMVLVNAVYFKGLWKRPFQSEHTAEEAFFESPGQQRLVPMMNQRGGYKYGESKALDAQVLEMQYHGGSISMVVFLPRDRNTGQELDDMVDRLNANTLQDALRSMYEREVWVKLPKFKFEKKMEEKLRQALIAIGIVDLFSGRADMTNFKPDGGLAASKIIHKAVIEVNEEGAEAAAATALFLVRPVSISIPVQPKQFTCNRPFLFIIRDNELNNILFVGAHRTP